MGHPVKSWLDRYCPQLGGQFLFLDPVSWRTHRISAGAVRVLHEAAEAIESGCFEDFLAEVEQAGGWPPGLEFLVRSLETLSPAPSPEQPG